MGCKVWESVGRLSKDFVWGRWPGSTLRTVFVCRLMPCSGQHIPSQERMADARDLFRNEKSTEFVIVTIPTIMAMSESVRLADSLKREGVPLHTIVVNQVCVHGERCGEQVGG